MPVVLNISPIQQKECNNRHVTTNGRFRQLRGRFKCFGVIFAQNKLISNSQTSDKHG